MRQDKLRDKATSFLINKLQIATSAESRLAMTIYSIMQTFNNITPVKVAFVRPFFEE